MKQTNNALTFLNSSYQAVFKHAYFVGIASSFALGFTIPYANAASFVEDPSQAGDVTLGSGANGKFLDTRYTTSVTMLPTSSLTVDGYQQNAEVLFTDSFTADSANITIKGNTKYEARLTGGRFTDSDPITGVMTFNNSNLNINNGKVEANAASFNGGTITIGGKAGSNGSETEDLYINYSSLRTGQFSEEDPGATSFYNVTLNMGDYSAIDAMGDVSFERSVVTITAAKHENGVDSSLGEIAAKAMIRATKADFISGTVNIKAGTNKKGDAAIFADELNFKGANVTINANTRLQLAGKINLTNASDPTIAPIEGKPVTSASYTNTTYNQGKLNISSGNITNNGTLVFGGNSLTVSPTDLKASQYSTNLYEIKQTGGRLTNTGTIELGQSLYRTNTIPVDTSKGSTVYTLDEGTIANTGTILVNQGSKLDLVDGVFSNTGTGKVVLNSGSSLSVAAEAISGQAPTYSITRGEKISKVKLDSLGNVEINPDTSIELKNGVFTIASNSTRLGKLVLDNLRAGENLTPASWIVNDATIQLDSDLNLSTDKITNAGFSGTSTLDQAVISTTGTLNFKTQSGSDIGDLAGFDKLQGEDVSISANDSNLGTLWLTYAEDQNVEKKTISATESLRTANAATLGIGKNVIVELTTKEFDPNVTSIATAENRTLKVHHVDTDIEIANGGALIVNADQWAAHDITTEDGSSLDVIGSHTNSAGEAYTTKAELIANNFSLNGSVKVDNQGALVAKENILLGSESEVTINDGSLLKANNITISGRLTFDNSSGTATASTFDPSSSVVANNSQINFGETTIDEKSTFVITDSDVTVDTLRLVNNNTEVALAQNNTHVSINGGSLNIKGDGDSNTSDLSVNIELSNGSTLNVGKAFETIGLQYDTTSSTFTLNDDFKQLTATNSTLQINLSNIGTNKLSSTEIDNLKQTIFTNNSTNPYLSFTDITLADITIGQDENGNNIVDVGQQSGASSDGSFELDVDDENTRDAILTNVSVAEDAFIAGGFKAVQTNSSGSESVNIRDGNQLNIYGQTSSGNLIQNINGETVGANLGLNAQLNLKASGKIGDILGKGGIVNIGADTDVAVDAANINVAQINITNASLNAQDVTAESTKLNNAQLAAKNFTAIGKISASNSSSIDVSETLTLQQGMQIDNGTSVSAKNILVSSGDLAVGTESGENTAGSTGALVAQNLDLNGNSLILDPEFGQKTATAFIQSFADLDGSDADSTATDIMKINGNIIVGRNSALGLGGDEADFTTELAKLQDKNGSLKQDGIGALMFANQTQIALNGNKIIIGTEDIDDLKAIASGSDTIYLGQNAGLQVGVKALGKAIKDNELIFSDLGSTDTINAQGGTLIVPVDTESKEIAAIFGTDVQLKEGTSLKVQTDNGAYTGVIDSNDDLHGTGDFKLEENENTRNILGKMSDPTYEYYQNVLEHGQANNTLDFIKAAGSQGDGSALEQAGRLGAFGAGAQIALQTSQIATDAIMQRVGATSSVSNADQSVIENGTSALFITPIYKKSSSENLAADNLGYGSDIDLYGVAAGFDHNVNDKFKFGAMFNAGKGDASGSGVAAGVNNEFTYYGGGIYASVQPTENLALSADVSYTAVSNDIKANTGLDDFGDLTGNADSTALSAGINAQYAIKAGNFEIAPHAGVRYTKLDLDTYDVKVDNEQLAQTTTETASVVSVPVGVRLSANIINGNWNIKPSADFTVTSNFGDKTLKSTTTFAGQDGAINYNTNFIDSMTYGAKADIQIQNGNFSVGAGVGYTKSSNTDELSVGANIRLDF